MPPKAAANAARNPQIEQHLTDRQFNWTFQMLPLEALDEDRSLKNQARIGKPIDQNTVARYATAMDNGDVFPAIIAAEVPGANGLMIVDGNHRYQALKSIDPTAHIATYVIVGAPIAAITVMTFEANTRHGLPTNEADRLHQGLWLMDNGLTAEEAARRLGVKAPTLRALANEQENNRRADEAGIPRQRWEKLPRAIRQRLGSVTTDEGFAAMTKLVLDANLGNQAVAETVTQVNQLRSSKKQTEFVGALRDTYARDLQTGGLKAQVPGKGRSPRTHLGMCLGQIGTLRSAEAIAEHMAEDERPEWIRRIDQGIDTLVAIRDAMKK